MPGKPRRIARNVVANYLGQGWAALMAIAFLPVYVSALGFEAYGLIGFFAVLQSVLAVFDFGVTTTLAREAARQGSGARNAQSLCDLMRSFELTGAISNTLLAIVVWSLAERLASEWVRTDTLAPAAVVHAIALMGAVIAIRLQEGIYRGLLLGLERQVAMNVAHALLATVRYGGAVAVLYYGAASIVAFFAWQVAVSLASLATFAIFTYRRLPVAERPPRFSLASLRAVWRFSGAMALVTGLSVIMANLDRLVLSGILRLDAFGRYALAAAAAGVLYLLVVPITQAFYPRLVGFLAGNDRVALIRTHHVCSQLVAVTSGSVAIMLMIFPGQILYVWSGDPALAAETAPILAVLSAAAFANCLGHLGHTVLSASGSTTGLLTTGFAAVALTFLLMPPVAAIYDVEGAAVAWLGIGAAQATTLLLVAHRSCLREEGSRWLARDILAPFFAAIAVAWLFSVATPQLDAGRVVLAAYLLAASGVTFAVSALVAPDIRMRLGSALAGKQAPSC